MLACPTPLAALIVTIDRLSKLALSRCISLATRLLAFFGCGALVLSLLPCGGDHLGHGPSLVLKNGEELVISEISEFENLLLVGLVVEQDWSLVRLLGLLWHDGSNLGLLLGSDYLLKLLLDWSVRLADVGNLVLAAG